MAFEAKKFSELFDTMRGRSTVLTDFEVGSVTRTLVESFAYEMAALYEKMNLVYLAGFVDTAEGIQLDQVVAVLGIQRNLPDYAVGEVSFLRDTGSSDITIPIGTLVATEDTEEKPRKTYLTLEEKVLAQSETTTLVKVRAFERGEEQVTAATTIKVMPRPIPGIKEVNNSEATRFLGKRRETDDELRRRAKNALIQSGKATYIAIENALLSTPGIKEALVKEYFHFARGKVTVSRKSTANILTLPKGTLITGTYNGVDTKFLATVRTCRLLEELRFDENQTTFTDVGIESTEAAEAGEILNPNLYDWNIIGHTGDIALLNFKPIAIEEYGVIHVLIDGPAVEGEDMAPSDKKAEIIENKAEILALIEKWRAAGIYVYLKNVTKIKFGGIFRIAISPALKLSPEDRRAYEQEVEAAIRLHMDSLRVGEALKFPKLFQQILDIDGIDTVEALRIRINRTFGITQVSSQYELADNQITINDESRFDTDNPEAFGYISVASEEKTLPFDLEFKYTGTAVLDKAKVDALTQIAQGYLEGNPDDLKIGGLQVALGTANLDAATFKISAEAWSSRPVVDSVSGKIDISFVERALIRKAFIYKNYVDLTGAVKIKFPAFYSQVEKNAKITQIGSDLTAYLNALAPEESVDIPTLAQRAKQIAGVLDASVDVADFQVFLNSVKDDTRIKPGVKTIRVDPFEKARFQHLLISGDVERLTVERTQLEISVDHNMPAADQNTLQAKIAIAFNTFSTAPGADLVFGSLKAALESAAPGLTFSLTQLGIKASSTDNRVQFSDLSQPTDILVRSVELPQIKPITATDITLILT